VSAGSQGDGSRGGAEDTCDVSVGHSCVQGGSDCGIELYLCSVRGSVGVAEDAEAFGAQFASCCGGHGRDCADGLGCGNRLRPCAVSELSGKGCSG
jgi:hypothetical protein